MYEHAPDRCPSSAVRHGGTVVVSLVGGVVWRGVVWCAVALFDWFSGKKETHTAPAKTAVPATQRQSRETCNS